MARLLMTLHIIYFGIFIHQVRASLFCPITEKPSRSTLELAHVYEKKTEGLTSRRISMDPVIGYELKPEYDVYLATSREHVCGGTLCTFELATNENNVREGWYLHQHNLLGGLAHPGYHVVQTAKEMYCVIFKGDCGAVVPIYRHAKITKDGMHHSYTVGENEEVEDHVRELVPVCYGWSAFDSVDALLQDSSCGPLEADELTPLYIFDNERPAPFRDHYYTTKLPTATELEIGVSEFSGYILKDDLGLVAKNSNQCGCLTKMLQFVDNQSGIFGRLDHKFIMVGKETSRPLENYHPTGEQFYCAKRANACGATIPVRKYFHYGNIDTIYTANSTVLPDFSSAYPDGVLCYIWDTSYSYGQEEKQSVYDEIIHG